MVLDYRGKDAVYLEEVRGPRGNAAQRWRIHDIGGGLEVIENVRLSRERKTPMVLDYGNKDSVYLETRRGPKGNAAQRWRLPSVEDGRKLLVNVRLSDKHHRPMVLDYRD